MTSFEFLFNIYVVDIPTRFIKFIYTNDLAIAIQKIVIKHLMLGKTGEKNTSKLSQPFSTSTINLQYSTSHST